ncbi:MAG TPA: GNAT family N-acetyltransferase [Xanthomonadaceae bacterium]|nr:GNAT family N-acetyltransferase [Xanthomonadaceae bacterium]
MGLPAIEHDRAIRRFELEVEGHRAELQYRLGGGRLAIVHTGVPTAIGGRGIAARLVEAAVGFAREQGLRVVPECSYAEAFFRRHPQYGDVLAG